MNSFYMTLLFNKKMFLSVFIYFKVQFNTYPYYKQQLLQIVIQMKTTILYFYKREILFKNRTCPTMKSKQTNAFVTFHFQSFIFYSSDFLHNIQFSVLPPPYNPKDHLLNPKQ